MNPPTSFKEFATQLKLPTNMETAASTIGFNLRPIALRSMLDTVTLGRPVPAPNLGLSGQSKLHFIRATATR